ncbi:MAG TPA: 2-oxoglutarate and iron-dependent oxygenase domain-containing protein [Candidatus Nanoarchaeia archaeon]|nr:2-oxoglutarate and iron-dependent oxygenase domain-containing protein [Candidatus Nanoarchaeia archaeon]
MDDGSLGVPLDYSQIARNSRSFGESFRDNWLRDGFTQVENNDPELAGLKDRVNSLFKEFCALSDDVKMKYRLPKIGGQRGYTPTGIGSSSKGVFLDHREHLMIGPGISDDHPLAKYRPYFYLPNQQIGEVPELVGTAEKLLEKLEERDLELYTALAVGLGLHPSYFSARLAYGDSSLRLRRYPGIEGRVLGIHHIEHDGLKVNALVVRMPDGKFVTNLVRASPHRDVDFAATLFGAEEPGLMLEKPSGEIIPYTTVSNCMVDNSGFFATYETAGTIPYARHWVVAPPERAHQDRVAVIKFAHSRPRSPILPIPSLRTEDNLTKYPMSYEGVLLWQVLHQRDYATAQERDKIADVVRNDLQHDGDLVADLLRFEDRTGNYKLHKHVKSPEEYRDILELKAA